MPSSRLFIRFTKGEASHPHIADDMKSSLLGMSKTEQEVPAIKSVTPARERITLKSAFRSRPALLISLIAVVFLIVFGWIWWTEVYTSPDNIFWSMIKNSVSTSGVTKHIYQKNDSGSMDQLEHLNLGKDNTVTITTTLTQKGDAGDNTVVTDGIGTKSDDYVKYSSVKTPAKGPDGKPLDFSKVINVWGKSDPNTAKFLDEAMLGALPVANLNKADRDNLVKYIKNNEVYSPGLQNVKKTKQNGRRVYVYTVYINPEKYASLLQQFCKAAGIPEPQGLNPNDYKNASPVQVQFTVDVTSRKLLKVDYLSNSHTEEFSNYGQATKIDIPKSTISVTELQNRIQSVH